MKHASIIAAILLAGCAAAEYDFDDDAGAERLGTTEQAVTYVLPEGFGQRAATDGSRCIQNPKNFSQSNPCVVPNRRNKSICIMPKPTGALQDHYNAMVDAVKVSAALVNIQGYTYVVKPAGTECMTPDVSGIPGHPIYDLTVFQQCRNLSGTTMGKTDIAEMATPFTGQIIGYTKARVLIDTCKVSDYMLSSLAVPVSTVSQIRKAISNVTKHEMGHTAGLGHNPQSFCDSKNVMGTRLVPNCLKIDQTYSDDEKTRLSQFDVR